MPARLPRLPLTKMCSTAARVRFNAARGSIGDLVQMLRREQDLHGSTLFEFAQISASYIWPHLLYALICADTGAPGERIDGLTSAGVKFWWFVTVRNMLAATCSPRVNGDPSDIKRQQMKTSIDTVLRQLAGVGDPKWTLERLQSGCVADDITAITRDRLCHELA